MSRGSISAITTSPMAVAEPVKSSTSHVRAMVKTPSPSDEQVCPIQSRAKGRFWSACRTDKRLVIVGKIVLSLVKLLKKAQGKYRREEWGRYAVMNPLDGMVGCEWSGKTDTSGSVKQKLKGVLKEDIFVDTSLPMNATCS